MRQPCEWEFSQLGSTSETRFSRKFSVRIIGCQSKNGTQYAPLKISATAAGLETQTYRHWTSDSICKNLSGRKRQLRTGTVKIT